MIAIHYFASIREALDCDMEQIEIPQGVATVGQLLKHLAEERGEPWAEVLGESSLMIAVNHEMADRKAAISNGDELAFFPPVTGG